MKSIRQIPSWLRILLCALLCIGATLDDIDYINAIRAPRTMNSSRASSMADDDSDDQHTLLSPAAEASATALNALGAPVLAALYTIRQAQPPTDLNQTATIRCSRAPPSA